MSLRVLMLNCEFPPIGGGAANATYYLLTEFARSSAVTVNLITAAEGSVDSYETFSDNILVERLSVSKKRRHLWSQQEMFRYLVRASRRVRSLLRSMRFDLIHAIFGIPSGLIAYKERRIIPYVLSLRGSDVPGFNARFTWQHLFLKPLLRRVWRHAYSVTANSRGLRALAWRTYPGLPIRVIPNGVDTLTFRPTERAPNRRTRFLTVARLIPRKGLDCLIDAFGLLHRERVEAELTIVGGGDFEDKLSAQARSLGLRDRIDFRGELPHDDLPAVYAEHDVFVLPSLNEGMSNAVLEAMAAGLPVVTTPTGGAHELLDGAALFVAKRNPAEIASRLAELINDPHRRHSLAVAARKRAERFSWGRVADEYLELYRKVMRPR